MKDYYKILGLSPAAAEEKIRRAYRILARRYHPDVNPDKGSEEKFKEIAEAYHTLTDSKTRKAYNEDYANYLRNTASNKLKSYQRAAEQRFASASYYKEQKKDLSALKAWQRRSASSENHLPLDRVARGCSHWFARAKAALAKSIKTSNVQGADIKAQKPAKEIVSKISIIEVPVNLREAIYGVTKTVSIEESQGERKISVKIPAGVRTGSIVRLKSSGKSGEEVIAVVRLERHPFISIDNQGLVVEIPVTVNEALAGATIKVPTLDEPTMVKIAPNTQSGTRIRVKDKGIPDKDGLGDLFVRVLIRVPESEHAVGLKEKCAELDLYYEAPVRANLPKTLLEPWT